jgi:hypothetical protein
MRTLTVIACAALLGACASSPDSAQVTPASSAANNVVAAADVTGSEATDSGRSSSDDVGLVCKRVKETGTRFSYKVCTTRAQREEAAANAANAARDWTIRNQQAGGPLEGG